MEEKSFSKLKKICLIYKDKIRDLCIKILQENFSKRMPLESMCGAPGCWRHVREDPENSEVLVIPVWDWGRGGGGGNKKVC